MLEDSETYAKPTPADWLRTRLTLSAWSLKVGFGLLWLALTVFTFWEAADLPYGSDDFFFCLDFLNKWQTSHGIVEKYHLLFTDTNGSITATLRLVMLAWFGLTGSYSFVYTSVLNAILFGLLAFSLYRLYFPQAGAGALFLSGLLFCKPIYQENLFLTNGSQNLSCLLLGLFSLHFAARADRPAALWRAALLAIATGWTSGNGPLVFLIVPVVLVLLHGRRVGPWLGVWAVWALGFFLHYATVVHPGHNPFLSEILHTKPWLLVVNVIYLVGGGLEVSRWMLYIEAVAGVLLLAGFAVWGLRGGARRHPALAGLLLFLLGSVCLAVLGRSVPEFNLEYTLPPRYKQFPYTFLSIGFYLIFPWLRERLGMVWAFAFGGGLALVLLVHLSQVYRYADATTEYENRRHAAALLRFAQTGDPQLIYTLAAPEDCARILKEAKALGVYDYEARAAACP